MRALRRVLRAPGLWALLVIVQLLIAKIAALPLTLMVAKTIKPFSIERLGGLLPPLVELFIGETSLVIALAAALVASAVLSVLLWVLLGGGIVWRLHREGSAAETFAAAIRHLPSMAVLSIYNVIVRVFLLLALGLLGLQSGPLQWIAIFLVWSLTAVALDLARSEVVQSEIKAFHPRTLVRGFSFAFSHPRIWLASALLTLVGIAITLAILVIASRSFGEAGLWLYGVRVLAALGVGVSLWRIAIAVVAREENLATDSDSDSNSNSNSNSESDSNSNSDEA